MNRFLLILCVDFTLCLLFTSAQDEFSNFLPSRFIKQSYNFLPTTVSTDPIMSPNVEYSLNTKKNKSMAERKLFRDLFGTPPSLGKEKPTLPLEIDKEFNNSLFGPKFGTLKNETSTEIIKEPPDSQISTEIPKSMLNSVFGPKFGTLKNETSSEIIKEPQNSTDTSNVDDRFLTPGMLKYNYHGPENHINDNQVPDNHDVSRQGLIPERRITRGHTEKQNDFSFKNAANSNLIPSLLILFQYFIVIIVF